MTYLGPKIRQMVQEEIKLKEPIPCLVVTVRPCMKCVAINKKEFQKINQKVDTIKMFLKTLEKTP